MSKPQKKDDQPLSAQWYIYRESMDPIGPFTASEIRQSLRQGTLDPFDMAGLEGSSVRQQLVEIDEIFADVAAALHQDPDNNRAPPSTDGMTLHNAIHASPTPRDLLDLDSANLSSQTTLNLAGQGRLHLASPQEKSQDLSTPFQKLHFDQQPKQPKDFYLSTGQKNRRAGPFSASEIAAMFRGKRFPPNLKVIRLGPDFKPKGQIPLARFMGVYGGHNPKLPARRQPYQPTSELAKLAKRAHTNERIAKDRAVFLSILAMIMLIAAILVIAFTVVRQTRIDRITKLTSAKTQSKNPSRQPAERTPVGRSKPSAIQPPPPQDDPFKSLGKIPAPVANKLRKEKRSAKQTVQERKTKLPARFSATLKDREQTKPKLPKPPVQAPSPKPSPAPTLPPKPLPPPLPPPPPAPAPPQPPVPAPAPVPAPQPKPSTPALADASMANRYGPLACPKPALAACDGSCSISCNGPQGTVTIMFFKGVWGTKIEAKAASLYVSGFVRSGQGSGTRIIVSDVQ